MKLSRLIFSSLLVIVFVFGCSGVFQPIPLPVKFCDDSGNRTESWLLNTSHKLIKSGDMTREEMLSTIYYSMIRLAAIGQLAEGDKDFVEKWWRKVGEFYVDHAPAVSWNDLIDYMFSREEWGDKVKLIKVIVTPSAVAFRSIASINDWDDCALRAGHANVGEIFGWAPIREPKV